MIPFKILAGNSRNFANSVLKLHLLIMEVAKTSIIHIIWKVLNQMYPSSVCLKLEFF